MKRARMESGISISELLQVIRDALCAYLSKQDILRLGSTCKLFKANIRDNSELWKNYLISTWPSDMHKSFMLPAACPPSATPWMAIQFKYKTPGELSVFFQRLAFTVRFKEPQSSLDYLRFFCQVVTTQGDGATMNEKFGVKVIPSLILQGAETTVEQHPKNAQDIEGLIQLGRPYLLMNFTHANKSSFIYFKGEGGFYTNYTFYAIDRRNPGQKIELGTHSFSNRSTMGKSNYEELGRLLYNDPGRFHMESFAYGAAQAVPPRVHPVSNIMCAFSLEALYYNFFIKKQ